MDATTGKPLAGSAHLAQSIDRILSTPIGTRVMRRDFGSAIAALVDAPGNALGRQRLIAATADALRRWEPRLRLTRVRLVAGDVPGAFAVALDGQDRDAPAPADSGSAAVSLTVPLRSLTA